MPETLEAPPSATVIDCAAYCSGARVENLGLDQIKGALCLEDRFVWLGLYEPEKEVLRQVQQQFGLHDLAIEDAYNAHQRPKLELYEDSVFVVLRTAHLSHSPRHLEFGETHVFAGPGYVVSVRHGPSATFREVHVRLRRRARRAWSQCSKRARTGEPRSCSGRSPSAARELRGLAGVHLAGLVAVHLRQRPTRRPRFDDAVVRMASSES